MSKRLHTWIKQDRVTWAICCFTGQAVYKRGAVPKLELPGPNVKETKLKVTKIRQ